MDACWMYVCLFTCVSTCMWVSMCVYGYIGICMGVSLQTGGWRQLSSSISLHPQQGFLLNQKFTDSVSQAAQRSPPIPAYQVLGLQADRHTCAVCAWMLSFQSLFLILTQQSLYPLSHLPSPQMAFKSHDCSSSLWSIPNSNLRCYWVCNL